MELRQLRYFQSVANLGSYTAASRTLNIAQPALSRHVQALEHELKTQLFVRTARGVQLTATGDKLLTMADFLIRYVSEIPKGLSGLATEPTGNVSVGLPPSVVHLFASALIERTRKEFPQLSIRIVESLSVSLLESLISGTVDIAVLTDPGPVPGIARLELAEEDMVLIGDRSSFPRGSRWASAELLQDTRLVVTPGFRGVIEPWLNAHHIRPYYQMDIDSLGVIKTMVGRGLISTIVPYGMVHAEIRKKKFLALPFRNPPLRRKLILAWSARRPISAGIHVLQDIIQQEIEKIPVLYSAVERPRRPKTRTSKKSMTSLKQPRSHRVLRQN